ncbi:hypothetical protein O185_24790 [Photorhabdus temperata J3]|uniref:Uncharacterized protein n=1 Tax=Photorhabdus temperata J3 TaxID=1389415 RepID=U7QRH5_PHOTE|nr:hypothetical protein O185_24790 [Photorhabdus temperata J3]
MASSNNITGINGKALFWSLEEDIRAKPQLKSSDLAGNLRSEMQITQ